MKALLLIAVSALSMAATSAHACVDGTRSLFAEHDQYDREVNVWKTCVNGAFYPKTVTVAQACKDGEKTYDYQSNGINDSKKLVVRTCKNGRYYPVAVAKITNCKEGSVEQFTETSGVNSRETNVTKVCRAGKYVNP
jgi:hypothetical protein